MKGRDNRQGEDNMRQTLSRFGFIVFTGIFCLFFFPEFVMADETPGLIFERQAGLSPSDYDMAVHKPTGKASFLRFTKLEASSKLKGAEGGASPEDAAWTFMRKYGHVFGIKTGSNELKITKSKSGANGNNFFRFRQHRSGIPVFGGDIIVQVNSANQASAVNGKASDAQILSLSPVISAESAKKTAFDMIAKHYRTTQADLTATKPELWIYNPALLKNSMNREFLVWRFDILSVSKTIPLRELFLIDAVNGRTLLHFSQIKHAKHRHIYDADSGSSLPGSSIVRDEGGAASSVEDVNDAYDYTGYTYDFFYTYHGRDSIDGSGMTLISTVRYCPDSSSCPYGNAFWNGEQMVFGEGYASALDVVGHELTHGVTEHESGLFYYMQSGAINESLSDIWGELIQQTYQPVSSEKRWLMGEDLSIGAIRSMKDPTIYSQPDTMSSYYYVCSSGDNEGDMGGVHTNSGVGNKAAYLMVDGDTFNGITVGAIGRTKTIKIFYEAQTKLLTEASDYQNLYYALQTACSNLVGVSGITSSNCAQMKNALDAVEMSAQPAYCPTVEAPVCVSSAFPPTYTFNDGFESGLGNWTIGAYQGGNEWMLSSPDVWYTPYAANGTSNIFGNNECSLSDSYIYSKAITIPSNAYLHFNHAYEFEICYWDYCDGGVVEYRIGNGDWQDAGPLFDYNGYNGAISSDPNVTDNPLAGRSAFVGNSYGYGSSRMNLSSLAGESVSFRFRVASDSNTCAMGWWIDDVQVYRCGCAPKPVTISGSESYYSSVQAAYDAAANGDSILIKEATLTGSVTTDSNIVVRLKGGYSCDFLSRSDMTTLVGALTIKGGTVFIDSIKIK
jgi:bacillolysin